MKEPTKQQATADTAGQHERNEADCPFPECDCWEIKKRFSQQRVRELENANEQLKQSIKDLMPVLRDWEPDHSSPEERKIIRKAQELIVLSI